MVHAPVKEYSVEDLEDPEILRFYSEPNTSDYWIEKKVRGIQHP